MVTPLMEAVYADSATQDLKLVNPDLISRVRALEQHIDEIKRGMGRVGSTDEVGQQAEQFIEKWSREI